MLVTQFTMFCEHTDPELNIADSKQKKFLAWQTNNVPSLIPRPLLASTQSSLGTRLLGSAPCVDDRDYFFQFSLGPPESLCVWLEGVLQ